MLAHLKINKMAGCTTLWNQFSQHTCVRGRPPPKASLLSLSIFLSLPRAHNSRSLPSLFHRGWNCSKKRTSTMSLSQELQVLSSGTLKVTMSCHVMCSKVKRSVRHSPIELSPDSAWTAKKKCTQCSYILAFTNFLCIFRYMHKNSSCACLEGGSKTNSCFHRTISISCSKVFVQTPNGTLRTKTESNL